MENLAGILPIFVTIASLVGAVFAAPYIEGRIRRGATVADNQAIYVTPGRNAKPVVAHSEIAGQAGKSVS